MKNIFMKFILIENEILTMNFRYEDPSHGLFPIRCQRLLNKLIELPQ